MKEQWLPVTGWEGFYEVSNFGNVRSLDRLVTMGAGCKCPRRIYRGKTFTPAISQGYCRVKLSRGGQQNWRGVHQIVCEAFNGPAPSKGHIVAHWDGDKQNNRPENLRWATHAENAADKFRHGTASFGAKNASSKLTDEQVQEIRASSVCRRELASRFGIHKVYVSKIRSCVARPSVPVICATN